MGSGGGSYAGNGRFHRQRKCAGHFNQCGKSCGQLPRIPADAFAEIPERVGRDNGLNVDPRILCAQRRKLFKEPLFGRSRQCIGNGWRGYIGVVGTEICDVGTEICIGGG